MAVLGRRVRNVKRRLRGRARDGTEFYISDEHRRLLINVLTYGSRDSVRADVDSRDLDPYIEYVCTSLVATGSQDPAAIDHPEKLIQEFAIVVEYFSIAKHTDNTVGDFIAGEKRRLALLFKHDDLFERTWRENRIYDAVSCIALWTVRSQLKNLFGNPQVRDRIFARPGLGSARTNEDLDRDGRFTIREIAEAAKLLPQIEPWVDDPAADPREAVPTSKLNARLITRVGRINIAWTFDLSEHMLHRHGNLYVFCMPSRLVIDPTDQEVNTPEKALIRMDFKREYSREVLDSYVLLFGAPCKALFEDLYNAQNFPTPKDPYLEHKCLNSPDNIEASKLARWSRTDFPYLWPRITEVENYVKDVQPDNFVQLLWRDRRDHYGWYTFVFAFAVLLLTFISTAFTGIQALKAFYPTNLAPPTSSLAPESSPIPVLATSTNSILSGTSSMVTITVTALISPPASRTATQPCSTTSVSSPGASDTSGCVAASAHNSGISTSTSLSISLGVAIPAILVALLAVLYARSRRGKK